MKKFIYIIVLFLYVDSKMIRDATNEVVFDTTTKKMWQDDSKVKDINYKVSWEAAIEVCENLDLGGFTDWRLPNKNELNTIVDLSKYDPSLSEIFIKYDLSSYWSSTNYGNSTALNKAWSINFTTGDTRADQTKTELLYVRCVRDL